MLVRISRPSRSIHCIRILRSDCVHPASVLFPKFLDEHWEWGGPPGPRPTPSSVHVLSAQTEPDPGVQRGRGRPPHAPSLYELQKQDTSFYHWRKRLAEQLPMKFALVETSRSSGGDPGLRRTVADRAGQ